MKSRYINGDQKCSRFVNEDECNLWGSIRVLSKFLCEVNLKESAHNYVYKTVGSTNGVGVPQIPEQKMLRSYQRSQIWG